MRNKLTACLLLLAAYFGGADAVCTGQNGPDGFLDVAGGETCDINSASSPGCVECLRQPGWFCSNGVVGGDSCVDSADRMYITVDHPEPAGIYNIIACVQRSTRTLLWTATYTGHHIGSIALASDGRYVAVGGGRPLNSTGSAHVEIYDADSGVLVFSSTAQNTVQVHALSWAHDDSALIATGMVETDTNVLVISRVVGVFTAEPVNTITGLANCNNAVWASDKTGYALSCGSRVARITYPTFGVAWNVDYGRGLNDHIDWKGGVLASGVMPVDILSVANGTVTRSFPASGCSSGNNAFSLSSDASRLLCGTSTTVSSYVVSTGVSSWTVGVSNAEHAAWAKTDASDVEVVTSTAFMVGITVTNPGLATPSVVASAPVAIPGGYTEANRVVVMTTMTADMCGNGVVVSPESCEPPSTLTCGDNCLARTQVCGDAFVTGTETCDDGGTTSGDGCSAACAIEPGYTCTDSSIHPTTCAQSAPVCGDGLQHATFEECDDGNLNDNDGCNGLCKLEGTSTCTGQVCQCGSNTDCGAGGTCSAGACLCPADKFGPRCTVSCGTECTSTGGVCSPASLNADYCNCPSGKYPSSNPKFGPRCARTCTAATCAAPSTCDHATGDCISDAAQGSVCDVCYRYTGSGLTPTPGFGAWTFATIVDAMAHPSCMQIRLACQAPLSSVPQTITSNNHTISSAAHMSASGMPLILTQPLIARGTMLRLDGVIFPDTISGMGAVLDVDVNTLLQITNDLGIPATRPATTTAYTNTPGNWAGDQVCGSRFTRGVLDSFFDVFTAVVYKVAGSDVLLRASPFLTVQYLYHADTTPENMLCITLYMAGRGLAPSFLGRKRPGSTTVMGQVHSPFVVTGQIIVGAANAINVNLNTGMLTMTGNTFIDVPGTAASFQGVDSMTVNGNTFVSCGGTDSASMVVIEGVPGFSTTTGSFTNNVISQYRSDMTVANRVAFHLKNIDAPTLTITGNVAPLTGSPLTGFTHGLFLDNVPLSGATPCGPSSDANNGDERCVALANPRVQGLVTHITRSAQASPAAADYCNDLCPLPFVLGSGGNNAAAEYEATSVVFATQVVDAPQAIAFSVDFSVSNVPYMNALPVVEFVPVDEVTSPRQRSSCSSRLSDPTGSWYTSVFALAGAANADWTLVNTTGNAGTSAYTVTRTMALDQLMACTEYNGVTPVVAHEPTANTYSMRICTALISPRDIDDESLGWIVVHRACTPVTLTVDMVGSVLVRITTAQMNFDAHVLKSRFELATDPSPNQLEITIVTSINALHGEDLREPIMTSAGNSLIAPFAWTVSAFPACDAVLLVSTQRCVQTWTVTSNQESQTTQELFLGIMSFTFAVYRNGAPAVGSTLATFTASVNIERAGSQHVLNRITATGTVYRDYDFTTAYDNDGGSFVVGEKAYIRVCADLAPARVNEVDLQITTALYCTPTFPLDILPYDPLNPTTTGCATIGAGIGDNHDSFYVAGNSVVNTEYTSAATAYPGNGVKPADPSSCKIVEAKVDHWIGDRVQTYLQILFTMTSTIPGAVGNNIPIPTGTIHAANGASVPPVTTHVAIRVPITRGGAFTAVTVPGRITTPSNYAHNQTLGEVDSPAHMTGLSVRVRCANDTHVYRRIENKRFNAQYACINLAEFTEVDAGSFAWYQPKSSNIHDPTLVSSDPMRDSRDATWFHGIILTGILVVIIIIAVTVCTRRREPAQNVIYRPSVNGTRYTPATNSNGRPFAL